MARFAQRCSHEIVGRERTYQAIYLHALRKLTRINRAGLSGSGERINCAVSAPRLPSNTEVDPQKWLNTKMKGTQLICVVTFVRQFLTASRTFQCIWGRLQVKPREVNTRAQFSYVASLLNIGCSSTFNFFTLSSQSVPVESTGHSAPSMSINIKSTEVTLFSAMIVEMVFATAVAASAFLQSLSTWNPTPPSPES